jgi:thioredoxin 1
MSTIKTISESDFEELKKAEGIYLLDFWADWCPPCKAMHPVLETLSKDEDLKEINFGKIDVDAEQGLMMMFKVSSIPTFYLIKFKGDGTFSLETDVLGKTVGASSPFDFKTKLLEFLKNK